MACNLLNPLCVVGTTAEIAVGTAHGVASAASGTASVVGAVGRSAGAMGSLLPLLIIVGMTWLGLKLLGLVRHAGEGVARVYATGPMAAAETARPSKANAPSSRARSNLSPKPSAGSARTAQAAGAAAATNRRRRAEVAKGPQPVFHDGTGGQVIRRDDDKLGRPVLVTVCAANAGEAMAKMQASLTGHGWRPAGVSRCDLAKSTGKGQPRTLHHFSFRKVA